MTYSFIMKILAVAMLALFNLNISGTDVITKMHNRYAGKWHKTLTFVQTTGRYTHDTLRSTTTWNEALSFPYDLRIDLGDKKSGNTVIYTKDSTYNFRNNKRLKATTDGNDLIFLVGGMYHLPLEIVLNTIKMQGYNLDKSFESEWKGHDVYVVGAGADGEKVNQLWIDKDKLVILRMIKYEKGTKQECLFEDHVKVGNAWIETNVSFYVNDKLLQTEQYKDVKPNVKLNPAIFDPAQFGKASWY